MLVVAVLAGTSTKADAFVYYTQNDAAGYGGAIGRAANDGSGRDAAFIRLKQAAAGVAVDDQHIYWTTSGTDGSPTRATIGRANLDGTQVTEGWITGVSGGAQIAVDKSHLYWDNVDAFNPTLGRANLDGSGVDQAFIKTFANNYGVTVDGQYIYWSTSDSIGRANLDGTAVSNYFIPKTGMSSPRDIAVASGYPYWSSATAGVYRANLDRPGSDSAAVLVGGASAMGLNISGNRLLVGVCGGPPSAPASATPGIRLADLDGRGFQSPFIDTPCARGIASDSLVSTIVTPQKPKRKFTGLHPRFATRAGPGRQLGRLTGIVDLAGAPTGTKVRVTCSPTCGPRWAHSHTLKRVRRGPRMRLSPGIPSVKLKRRTKIRLTVSYPGYRSTVLTYVFQRRKTGVVGVKI